MHRSKTVQALSASDSYTAEILENVGRHESICLWTRLGSISSRGKLSLHVSKLMIQNKVMMWGNWEICSRWSELFCAIYFVMHLVITT